MECSGADAGAHYTHTLRIAACDCKMPSQVGPAVGATSATRPPKKLYTLVVIHQATSIPGTRRVLLGRKLRGFGEGYWNGYGGKVEKGEGVEAAAARELHEEAGVAALDLHRRGILTFEWVDQPGDPTWEVHVFGGTALDGEPVETEEMAPGWFEARLVAGGGSGGDAGCGPGGGGGQAVTGLPFDKMWADDPQWYPLMLGVEGGGGRGGAGRAGMAAPAADGSAGPLFVGAFQFQKVTELVGGRVDCVDELPPLPAPA